MRITYFLPKYNFFTQTFRGRTSHAHGFVSGLRENGIDFTLVSGPGYGELYGPVGTENLVVDPSIVRRSNLLWVLYASLRIIFDKRVNTSESVLVVRYSTSMSMITSMLFGSFWKGTTIYEVNSIGYHQVSMRSQRLLNFVLAVEKYLIGRFDTALCVSENIAKDLESSHIRSFVLPNGSSLPPVQLFELDRSPRFVYLGGYQPYYDFDQLFRCFSKAQTGSTELHIYGAKERFESHHPEIEHQRSIHLKGSFDLRKLLDSGEFSRRDIFLLPNGRNRMARIGSPTKLFEYLALGVRIIYQDYGQPADILKGMKNVYPYDGDASLIECLEQSVREFDEAFESPVSATEYQATYTWPARVNSFRHFLEVASARQDS